MAKIVCPIAGDLQKENLGISQKDQELLIKSVSIIINCAASVDFNAPLNENIAANVFGTFNLFTLAQKF